jgi:hypothetical protein
MFLLHPICIQFQQHLPIYGLVEILFLWCFHQIGNLINDLFIYLFIIIIIILAWLLSSRMSTLKSPNIMIGQCFSDYSIIFWIFLRNVQIEHEWTLYTHTIYIFFCVLILKFIVMYYEPLLVVTLKESKCMCMSYVINNPWSSWIETYECYAHQLMCGVFLFL